MINEELEDLNLDDVFGNPDLNPNDPNAPTQTQVTPEPEVQPAPQTTEEPYLSTSTGTVYKSAEDAVKGIEHKDALISKLRQEAIERTGIDPVTGQPVRKEEAPVNYTQDGQRYLADLADAAKKGDANAYTQVQARLINDVLAPYSHVIAGMAKSQAIESVATEIPEFRTFVGSKDFSETVERHPLLKDAIAQCETDPSRAQQLSQFYRMAFELNQSRKLPELVQAQQRTVTPTKPTVTSTSLPSPTGRGEPVTPGFSNPESRKALIEQQEKAGVADLRF